nr:reverse transcriptase domain-containing protein [Tanacetum cinerariifolium]
MRTRSSSNLLGESPPNPSSLNPKCRNRRRSKQPFILEESPVVNQQTNVVTTAMTAILKQFQATPPPASVKAVEEICVTYGGAHPYYQVINKQTSVVTTTMTAILKQLQATPPLGFVKAVEDICVTCGGSHPYYQCLAAGGNTFPKLRDSIQGYVLAAAVNYNQGSGSLSSNTVANPKGELKAITTRSGIVLEGPTVPTPPPFINLDEETLTDLDLSKYTIKVPPPPLHINITLGDALVLMPKYQKMLKPLLSNKEKLQELANTPRNENCLAVILKKLPEKLRDPGKFLISCGFIILKKLPEKLGDPRKFLILCGFSELKCKALADLGSSINLMPLSVWKKLGLPELLSTRMT